MDLSSQYQQQQHLQYQPQVHTSSQSYDPSQLQPYDQSTAQSYYAYYQYNQQQYPYYHQYYTAAYQQEPTSIHPPGIPIPPEQTTTVATEQVLGQTYGHSSYYPQTVVDQQQPQPSVAGMQEQHWQVNNGGFAPVSMHNGQHPPIGQSSYRVSGRRGGRPFRGGSRGHSAPRAVVSSPSFRGRGRGGVHGKHFPSNSASASSLDPVTFVQGEVQGEPPPYMSGNPRAQLFAPAQVRPTPMQQPPRMAWCELCRVDCNTAEILEQHKNGKRHKKNLKVYEELQDLNKLLVRGQNEEMPTSEFKSEVPPQPEKVDGSGNKQLNLSSEAIPENKTETEEQKAAEEPEPTKEPMLRTDRSEARGRGYKRKMRGVRGAKLMRTYEGSRRTVDPAKPKEVIPLICELCNVKCDSQVVFETHLAGKKHLSNLKKFQSHQTMLGQVALQALYPALQALYPALQALYAPNANGSTSFAPQFHQQGVHGAQDFFAQPGPFMFPHGQLPAPGPGATSAPPPALEPQGLQITLGAEKENVATGEAKCQPQSAMVKFEAETAARNNTKSEGGTSESKRKEVNIPSDSSLVPSANTVAEP